MEYRIFAAIYAAALRSIAATILTFEE